MSDTIYKPEIRIYKPRKSNDGAASKLQMKIVPTQYHSKVVVFWVATSQKGVDGNGNASFDWQEDDKEVNMKLESIDLANIINTFTLITKETKLFHQNPKGNSTLTITKYDSGFNVRLSKKNGDKLVAVKHSITPAEARILTIAFTDAISHMGWR